MSLGAYAPLPLRLGGMAEEGWTAGQHARVAADVAAMARTKPFAHLTYSTAGGGLPTVLAYNGMNGVGVDLAPSAIGSGVGVTNWVWDQRYTDDFGVSHPTRLWYGRVTGSHATLPIVGTVSGAIGANTLTVRIWRLDNGAAVEGTVTLTVY